MGPNWVQVKVDAKVTMPERLDLTQWRGTGLKPGEVEMPADSDSMSVTGGYTTGATGAVTAKQQPPANAQEMIDTICSMGYSAQQAEAALQSNSYDIER